MKSFKKYIDAETYANEVSAKELKPISIVHLHNKKDFTVIDKKDEWFWGITHVMLITNFEARFIVHSISPKSGEHFEGFPTKELSNKRETELRNSKYRKNIFQSELTSEQYQAIFVTPYKRSAEISETYRQELLLM